MSRLSEAELLVFVDDLRLAVEAHLSIGEVLDRIPASSSHPSRPLADFARAVRSGAPLSEAVSASGLARPELASLLRAGERAGDVAAPLRQYALELERRIERRSAVGASLLYPAILLASVLATLLLFSTFTRTPRSDLLGEAMSPALSAVLVIFGGVLPILLFAFLPSVRSGRCLPGGLNRLETKARALRTLHVLLHGGVPLPEALRTTAGGLPDGASATLVAMADHLASGIPFADTLPENWLDPVERLVLARSEAALPVTVGRLAEAVESEIAIREGTSRALFTLLAWAVTGTVAGVFIVAAWSTYFQTLSEIPF